MEIIEELDKKLKELDEIQKRLDKIKSNIRCLGCSILLRIRPKR